ncbi:Copia protein [Symbiodinium microadriaticum]|uniref:Copia protein n=1 Tax=Symbiodinium microadriaticum TaxID=2951 RepID=A0A1Q9DZ69_SYMMI|nr:Copia protein [Symbiodinium microadriaticum]
MSSGVQTAGEQLPAASGDAEPATSEREVSEDGERHSNEEDWDWSDRSHGGSWWDAATGWDDWSWHRTRYGDEQGRRTSWATTWDGCSTDASARHGESRNHDGEDFYTYGGRGGSGGRGLFRESGDYEGVWQDPWADGRARGYGWHDSPEVNRTPEWTGTGHYTDPVWNGWRHFGSGNGGHEAGYGESTAAKGGNPRPSEKLSVPVFNGGDDEDVGTSARSYLRQVEAWRRLTYLPPGQQGLVLYRHLTGKAWVAAEELNVDALSRDDGVHYLMSWLRNRYLDLEVTRIGKALSEMFRKLRRKAGQSIRDYNAEYDRLHARLKEVGCMLPEECAAWLYVDRLQLEEGAELNLLASVGNTYSLGKLQKAAIIQDRGLRKPWEGGQGKGRRPFTAHVTDNGDDDEWDADVGGDARDDDADMPEEVAVAYMTYQSAKNKYREHKNARGYKGDADNADGGEKNAAAKARDEKLRQIKARSFCSGCGRRGHWHKDDECPNNSGSKTTGPKSGAAVKEVCVAMPAEVMTLKHISGTLLGITDTACARTVAGTQWLQEYIDRVGEDGGRPEMSKECEAYRFGTGRIHYSSFSAMLSFSLGEKIVQLRASIIPGDIPLLLSKTVLAKLGMIYDVSQGAADFTALGLKDFKLLSTPSGHPAIPIVPAKLASGCTSVLSIEDLSFEPRVQYIVHAVAFAGLSHNNLYNIFYDKKLPPEVKDLPISRMTKPQLLGESVRLGLVVHKSWSPEEIKAVIMEHRENAKQTDATERMKRLSHLTLDELKNKARELEVDYPEKVTKGNLLRLVRDSLNTPDNELMKIGKHRGMEFREVPWQYGQWASNEVKSSKNADPELIRFARWWDQNEEKKKHGYMKETIDDVSKKPMPPSAASSATSWESVSVWETSWPAKATCVGERVHEQMPIQPGTTSANSKRRSNDSNPANMEDEIDEQTAEEIKKLELRLALLKDKDYDVISDCNLSRALQSQHDVLATALTSGQHRSDLPPGEQLAKDAYDKADFNFDTLENILRNSELKPRRNDRGKAFVNQEGDHNKNAYFTFGLFTHGGVQGVTRLTVDRPHLCRYINGFGLARIKGTPTWTSVTLTKNVKCDVHRDYNNLKGTTNHTCSFGQTAGGELWLEDKQLCEGDAKMTDLVWRRGAGGAWLPGRLKDTFETFLSFDPHHNHASSPWQGDRWALTYHTTRGILKVGKECNSVLQRVGFPLPHLRGVRGTPSTRRPKKSIRSAIANAAAKLTVMMTTLLLAAGTYMSEQLPTIEPDPVVIFEIGGIDATYEAAQLNKAVIEPMTWDDYSNPGRREDAHHFVYGISPKELRVNLDEMPKECQHSILELAKTQVEGGGQVVFRGGDASFVIEDLAHYLLWNYRDDHGEAWTGFGKAREGARPFGDHRRPHQVFVVGAEGDHERQERVKNCDGSAITFETGVSPIVQSSLRRLHQNLGHPRKEDLVRHLRLAGCEEGIIKAVKGMKCEVCASTSGPRISRPSAVPRMYDFNDCVGADLLHHHDIDDERHTFLSIVDWGTSYHIVVPLSGFDGEDIEKAFNDNWVVPFGPPKTVSLDLDGAVQKGICRLCDWHNIGVKNVAAQAHWQAGITERQGAWWKNIWDRVRHDLSITSEEVHLAAAIVSSAKNELRRRSGHSPTEWVFGRHPRLPEDLKDPDNGEKVSWDVTPESQYQRAMAIRTGARLAFHHSQGDSQLRKALLQRARTTTRPIEVGETVHFWDQPKNRRRGRWAGPAVVVGREGSNYWISRNGRCRLTAPEHLRPSGPEEIGEYLRVRGAQAEVEKLLEMDLDADETYVEEAPPEEQEMVLDSDDEFIAAGIPSEFAPSDMEEDIPPIPPAPLPERRLKRKTRPEDIAVDDKQANETMFMKKELTRRGVEKRQEKELRWSEIPPDARAQFKEAEETQWKEHLSFDALEPLSVEESARVRREVDAERILRSRWAYKDKNWSRRRADETAPWRCKARLVIAGHTDPDLGSGLSTDAPTLSRPGLFSLLQKLANGLRDADPWKASAGDIRCAFLTGGYLKRDQELYLHQPTTGFAGLHPDQLVRVKKNIFGLATSPHEWWQDLQAGIKGITIQIEGQDHSFDQCALDPCVFLLRQRTHNGHRGVPKGYVGSHVDDLLVVAPSTVGDKIKAELSRVFPVETWEENEFAYLGSEIICHDDSVMFRQKPYIESRLFLVDIPKNAHEDDLADNECIADNRSLVGALSWVSAQSRPDLTCSVSMAQQLQKNPTYGDIKFTNGISLKATEHREEGLIFHPVKDEQAVILIYHDAAWANAYEGEYDEEGFELYAEDKASGLQHEGPPSHRSGRKAKRGNSRVASQLGELVILADKDAIAGGSGWGSILDWKSRAGQRVCRSTFSAETQAAVEGLEGGQYVRAMYEAICTGDLKKAEQAKLPLVCLSDCRSLYDHLHREGVPRTPADRRLAIDLAALRQGLRWEMWTDQLPLAWIPSELQLGDVLTKPQDPRTWWQTVKQKLTIPISIVERGGQACGPSEKQRTFEEACALAVLNAKDGNRLIKLLGENKIDIHVQDENGWTLLPHGKDSATYKFFATERSNKERLRQDATKSQPAKEKADHKISVDSHP